VPAATPMGPTRPSPYFHAGMNVPTAADTTGKTPSDTIKKPEHQP
jgi:hypothetical protein